jgi:hypothetical protein
VTPAAGPLPCHSPLEAKSCARADGVIGSGIRWQG